MKTPWTSKTHWMALILAILAFIPGVEDFIRANPAITVVLEAVIFLVIRWFTKSPVGLLPR